MSVNKLALEVVVAVVVATLMASKIIWSIDVSTISWAVATAADVFDEVCSGLLVAGSADVVDEGVVVVVAAAAAVDVEPVFGWLKQ